MTTSPAGYALIKRFETCSLWSYWDVDGYSIGWGYHDASIKAGQTCTQAQADDWLALRVGQAEAAINEHVLQPLTQGQFDALVDFTYNEGEGSLESSTMLHLINSGQFASAAEQFERWVYAGGKVSSDLMARRKAEQELFNSSEAA